MKKFITTVMILALGTAVSACGTNKMANPTVPNLTVEQDATSNKETKTNSDNKLSDSELDFLTQDTTDKTPTSNSIKGLTIIEEEVDYNSLEFVKREGIRFSCNRVENVIQTSEDTTLLFTKVTGSISGVSGTFDLLVPYSKEWKRGDVAIVDIEVAFPDEFKTYVRDLKFVNKADKEWDLLEEKRKEEERLEEEKRLAELAEKEAEEERIRLQEEERVRKEMLWKRQQEEIARQQALAQEAERLMLEEAERKQAEAAYDMEVEKKKNGIIFAPSVKQ